MPGDLAAPPEQKVDPYAWYMLAVMMLVYILNFVDRQLLTILAPDLKRDLGISDSDFGFLYGTAFGVFFAVFGIPLGKLADRWSRVRLLSIGLALWLAMTALSGLSRNFAQIGLARIGVGIGEATASPCAWSLISDCFPPQRRATALALYSSGLYLGGGISLFVGSTVAGRWNAAYAGGGAPFGLAGWQAAFMIVGLPGVLLALLVATLREPPRGRFEGLSEARDLGTVAPFAAFFRDLVAIVPPFTLIGASRRGVAALAVNLATAAALAGAAAWLIALTGDGPQWIAIAIGSYAIVSWAAALRHDDPNGFAALFRSRAFIGITLGYGLLTFIGYSTVAFVPLYAIQELKADPAEAGFMLGSLGALGGVIGVIGGGMLTDRLAGSSDHAQRIAVMALAALAMGLVHMALFTTRSLPLVYVLNPLFWIFAAATLGSAAGAMVNIVPPQARGVATAAFLLGTNMLGLAMGPYSAGKLSVLLGDLGMGLLAASAVMPLALAMMAMAWFDLRKRR